MGSSLITMWKFILLLASPLSCLNVVRYPNYPPGSVVSSLHPTNYLPTYITPYQPYQPYSYQPYGANTRVICSSCSCDDDFFCAFNCPKCSTDSFCSSCNCLTSLGCAKNCDSCTQPAAEPPIAQSPSTSCLAAAGPAAGKNCIFPFTFNGAKYNGCTELKVGLVSLYSPIYWCSTKVDINGFHVRGPYNNKGKNVGFCDDTCPRVYNRYYY